MDRRFRTGNRLRQVQSVTIPSRPGRYESPTASELQRQFAEPNIDFRSRSDFDTRWLRSTQRRKLAFLRQAGDGTRKQVGSGQSSFGRAKWMGYSVIVLC